MAAIAQIAFDVQRDRVLAVVHDRYFIARFASALWSVERGTVRRYLDLGDLRRGQANSLR